MLFIKILRKTLETRIYTRTHTHVMRDVFPPKTQFFLLLFYGWSVEFPIDTAISLSPSLSPSH